MRPAPAATIDEVIKQLTDIIDWAEKNGHRLGYFPALYRKVTIQVKAGIANGIFEDGPRMEKLDIIFANRYLDAFFANQASGNLTESWKYAFDTANRWRPIVLQHLLLGMNVHINLDLGIAAAQTVPPDKLDSLKLDFARINKLLADLINDVQNELAEIWPLLKLIDVLAGRFDEFLAKFGIELTRDRAWKVAETISKTPPDQLAEQIAELDQEVMKISRIIASPGRFFSFLLFLIRILERPSVSKNIQILS